MARKGQLLVSALLASAVFSLPVASLASRKATDMMSEALKQRAAGNLNEAISTFESALDNTSSGIQKTLARFMLGDCQLEAKRYADAARTFEELAESVTGEEERAEALFRLMQAEAGLGNRRKADAIFTRIRQEHKTSPYYELAQAFIKSEGLIAESRKEPEVQPVETVEPAAKPSAVAEPLVVAAKSEESKPAAADKPLEKTLEKPAAPKTEKAETVSRPVDKTVEKPAEKPAARPVDIKPAAPAKKRGAKVDAETARLLRSILNVEKAQGQEKDELVSKILGYQDQLKDGPDKAGMDKVLFDLAQTTARFGELLEACKTYDQVLTNHPASPLVEKAYFEAIRLRAVLGVHDAVVGWSKAFLAAFPASEYRSRVRALVEYSSARGEIDLGADALKADTGKKSSETSGGGNTDEALLADSEYVEASRKMKDGRYNLALVDFNRLSKKHSGSAKIWWDLALVNVQLEDFKNAQTAIKKMLEIDSSNEDANSLAGYINYRLENFEEAADAYEKAGEPDGKGVNFFDAKTASERMKKSAGSK